MPKALKIDLQQRNESSPFKASVKKAEENEFQKSKEIMEKLKQMEH